MLNHPATIPTALVPSSACTSASATATTAATTVVHSSSSSSLSSPSPSPPSSSCMIAEQGQEEFWAREIAARINAELPHILKQLLAEQVEQAGRAEYSQDARRGLPPPPPLTVTCSLYAASSQGRQTYQLAKVDIAHLTPSSTLPRPPPVVNHERNAPLPTRVPEATRQSVPATASSPSSFSCTTLATTRPAVLPPVGWDKQTPAKRRATGGLRISSSSTSPGEPSQPAAGCIVRRLQSDSRVFPQRRKRFPEKPSLQPSSLEKFIGGVWESIFSAVKLDPSEVIEQWQAMEASGQLRLVMHPDGDTVSRRDTAVQTMFGRMNLLARKISQTSRTCRSLEVIIQAQWVQAFDDRVAELGVTTTKKKAKKAAISEACIDFQWTEKELRNKMAIWRGYHTIKNAGGWATLVFAGMGLYRFCKYRVSFTEDTFHILRTLRHRLEVAADCLHPRWRSLLAIVGAPTERRYDAHPHDWVVCGPGHEAIPLAMTYHQWDEEFSFTHLEDSTIDEDAWGLYDPRVVTSATETPLSICQVCRERQSDDARQNHCACFPQLYGSTTRAAMVPVQVFRTPNGKNNGLLACCPFERGAAIGEFIGQITSGISNLDVMVGQTDRAAYQIWQGRQGNYTRFVNHSCQPNSQFERFVWLGKQRIILVSKGIEAEEEITVDYSDTYWKNLDKKCLCESAKCRYRTRSRGQFLTSSEMTGA